MLALALVAISVGFSNLAASIGLGTAGVSAAIRLRVVITFGLFEAGMPIIGLLIGNDIASSIGRQAKWIGAVLLVGVGCYGIFTFARKIGFADIAARIGKPSRTIRRQIIRRQIIRDQIIRDQIIRKGEPAAARQDRADDQGSTESEGATGSAPSAVGRGAPATTSARRGGWREWTKVAVSGAALSLDNLIAGFALGSYQVNLLAGAAIFGVVSIAMSLAGLELGAKLGGWAGDSGELIGGVVLVGVGLAIGFGLMG